MEDFTKELQKYLFYCEYQKKLDVKTIRAYACDLKQYEEYLYVGELHMEDKESIKAYFVLLHMRYKQKSVKRKIASIKAFYTYLELEEIIAENPMHKVKTQFKEDRILPRTIPANIIEMFISYLYEKKNYKLISEWQRKLLLRDIAVIETLFSTGMRISELCNLRDQSFDMENSVMIIKGKGAKERYLQIGSDQVMKLLFEYRNEYKSVIKKDSYFFVNRYGHRFSEQSARKMIYKYAKQAAIDLHITPHMFRHAFATLLLEEDVDIRYIQKMLGHSSIVTTQIYTSVSMKKQGDILRLKHPRNQMNFI